MKKTLSTSINQVDRLVLTGNGWSRLFGATRRVVKSGLFQNSLYVQGQALTYDDVSATQTVFAGRTTAEIVRDLFDLTYRIDFQSTNNSLASTNLTFALTGAYFNISSLLVGNSYNANLFTVPQYLLAAIMQRRGFAYIAPVNSSTFIPQARGALTGQPSPEQFQFTIAHQGGQVLYYQGIQPVVITQDVQNLTAYFQFMDEVYRGFAPDMKTPYEILDDIRTLTFVELFELPNGQFIVRSPQYNNTSFYNPTQAQSSTNRQDVNMVLSSSLNNITSSYTEQVENLVSRIASGYSADYLPEVEGLKQFAYCDGKLLDQFGLMETNVQANPNVNLPTSTNNNANNSQPTGLFAYAQYLMETMNGRLKTGTISSDLDTSVQVGYTFFDTTKYKFGYISHLSKHASVAGTSTMNLSLTYVRDAVPITSSSSPVPTQGSVAASEVISAGTPIISIVSGASATVQVPQLPTLASLDLSFNT